MSLIIFNGECDEVSIENFMNEAWIHVGNLSSFYSFTSAIFAVFEDVRWLLLDDMSAYLIKSINDKYEDSTGIHILCSIEHITAYSKNDIFNGVPFRRFDSTGAQCMVQGYIVDCTYSFREYGFYITDVYDYGQPIEVDNGLYSDFFGTLRDKDDIDRLDINLNFVR